jgi:hypothetical protein
LGLPRLQKAWNAHYFKTIDQAAEAWTTMDDEMIAVDDVAAAAKTPAEREMEKS